MDKSKIVDIPVKMEKFYGKGKMLHPNIEDVEELIKLIPKGEVVILDTLCQKLADNYGTDVTCPMRTGNAIKKISENYSADHIDETVPFWRVIKKDKAMIKMKGYEYWATKIEDEGFALSFTKSGQIKVDFEVANAFSF